MIKKRKLLITLCLSAAALVSACLLGKNTNHIDRITAAGDSGTLIFNRSGMTIKPNKQSATCVATTKSGFPVTATMTANYNSLASFFCEDDPTDMYHGMYYPGDDRYEDGYNFEFKVTLTNVGKVAIEDVLVNVGIEDRYYDIRPYVNVMETTDPFTGDYKQQISFNCSNTSGITSSFWLINVQITYPCK